ncbi:MAG: hypothetical protein IV100_14905 [Myxococcales bacterium]|nr:hypothetical protein [Myxococcales bacterium]
MRPRTAHVRALRHLLRHFMVAYHADFGAREGENTNEIRVQYELSLHLGGC